MPRHMHILYTLVHNVSNPQLSINWFKSLGQISVIELNVLAQMSLACSIAITIFTLHSEHVRIAILSGFQLVWSSELMVNLTFYIVVAMRDCEIWQFPVWSSFTYYKSTRKKERKMKEKIHFSMVNKVSCTTKKEYTAFEIWIQKKQRVCFI